MSRLLMNFEIPEEGKERTPHNIGLGLLVLFFGIIIDSLLTNNTILIVVYVPFLIIVGVISRYLVTLVILACLSTYSAYFFSMNLIGEEIELFFLRCFFLFFISYIVRILKGSIQKERQHIVEITITLAESIDARDKYTYSHSKNVAYYSQEIAKNMGLSQQQCKNIYLGGLLHDLGKIGIPENILIKPSRLTYEEYEIIKRHPEKGFEMLKNIPFFKENSILDMVLYHHERIDGKGYPKGLIGDDIPLVARIMSVADSFDAMTSKRIYNTKTDLEFAINEIHKNKGTQFDPEVAETLLRLIREGKIDIKNRNHSELLIDNSL